MLLVVGEALVELEAEREGPFSEDARFTPRPAGAAYKEARAAAGVGARVRFLARVGRDAAGSWIKRSLGEMELEAPVQEDPAHPTSLVLTGPDTLIYRGADAHLEPAGEAFFEGGTMLHLTAWPFGLDPGRTHAIQTVREGIRRALALSLDLNYHPRAFRGDLLEVIRPFMPFSYLKVDDEAARMLGLKPGELFQLAGTVLHFRPGRVRLLSLMDESDHPLPEEADPEEVYGRFLGHLAKGAEPPEALKAAIQAGES